MRVFIDDYDHDDGDEGCDGDLIDVTPLKQNLMMKVLPELDTPTHTLCVAVNFLKILLCS